MTIYYSAGAKIVAHCVTRGMLLFFFFFCSRGGANHLLTIAFFVVLLNEHDEPL